MENIKLISLESFLNSEATRILNQNGFRTLEDVLNNSDEIKALNISLDSIEKLRIHSELNIVSHDSQINQRLVYQGIISINSLANTLIAQIQQSLSGLAESDKITQLHQSAQAQTQFLNNILIGKRLSGELDVSTSSATLL